MNLTKPYKPSVLHEKITQVLTRNRLFSISATQLLMGTCAQESHLGKYRTQIGGGPALGLMGVEPDTFVDIQLRRGHKYLILTRHVAEDLEENDELSILVARLKYLDTLEPLPPVGDVSAMARYWFRHYNCGAKEYKAERVAQYIDNYVKYVCS